MLLLLFFFRQLRLLSPLLLCFVCSGSFCIHSSFSARCGSRYSFLPFSAFFLVLRLLLLFLIFLLVFRMLRLRLLPPVFLSFSLLWHLWLLLGLLLWLLLFLVAGSLEAVPQGSILPFLAFLLFLLSGLSQGSSFFITLFPGAAGSVSVSPPLCASLRFSSLRLRLLLCCYAWLSLGVSTALLLFLPRSDLGFPSLTWSPFGTSQDWVRFLSLSLDSQGCFLLWYPFLWVSILFLSSFMSRGSSSDVISFWVGSCFTWCSV